MFHLGNEASVPAWLATILLFTAAALLAVIAAVKRLQNDRFRWHWMALSAIFVYLSVDEAAVLHEQITSMFNAHYTGTFLGYGGWVGYGIVTVSVVGLIFLPFLLSLPQWTRVLFVLAGALFIGGAIGVEILALPYEAGRPAEFRWALLVALEESMELFGITLFIVSLRHYMQVHMPLIEIRFGTSATEKGADARQRVED